MKLSLCVPHYKEDTAIVRKFLSSVAIQENVDFNEIEVVIVNDGGDFDKIKNIKRNNYPFHLRMFKNEHGGVSATRNAAFDKSIGEYVMFCDVDDMFYSVSGLFIIMKEIITRKFDVFISAFMEEARTIAHQPAYVQHDTDHTFVHGKVYRRQYLIDNDIRWNPDLTIHEDSYFNFLAINLCDKENKGRFCKIPFYLWKWRDDSVCRHDSKYMLKTYNHLLESSTQLVRELLRRLRIDLAAFVATKQVYEAYFTMNKREWLDQENQEYRHITELRFKQYFEEFEDTCKMLKEKDKNETIMSIKNRMYREGMILESITFDDWISHIKALDS